MKTIWLTQRQFTIVDDEDYDKLNKYNWCAIYKKHTNSFYACRGIRGIKHKTIYMHRVILDAPDTMEVDHINGDTLDNRRCNIRLATGSMNQKNRKDNAGIWQLIHKKSAENPQK
jgi:hypothetical protein